MSTSTTRIAVIVLGLVLLLTVIGVIALALNHQDVPDLLKTLAVGDLTGLLGLLVPSDRGGAIRPPTQP